MSFSRAPLKRFNEHMGCAPPLGLYEIKPGELRGAASFDKSDRFRPAKPVPPQSPSRSSLMSPVRRTMSVDGLVEGSSGKKERNGMTLERKQQKLLENEIRSLVQQRGEQDKCLLSLEENLKKVEAKLLSAVREKTGLASNVTSLERQRAELKKVNDFLKSKVSTDTSKKRINSLTMELIEARNSLDSKSKELSVLQVNTDGQLKVLETDLHATRDTVAALKDRNKYLEDLHQVAKAQNDDLDNENARLNAVIQELRDEIQVVQRYLDEANEQVQELRLKLKEKSHKDTLADVQVEKLKEPEIELEQNTSTLAAIEAELRQKEYEALKCQQELQMSKEALFEMERRLENQELALKTSQKTVSDLEVKMKLANQGVEDSQTTVCQQEAELARLREVLRRTERELDERVAHLEQRCLFSEEERSKTQEQGFRRVEELKAELNLIKDAKIDEEKRLNELQTEHATLSEELTKEKALVDSLSVALEQERGDSEERFRQLSEEMEEVLGELVVLEEQELSRQQEAEKRQEALERLQEEKDELERKLSDAKSQLDSRSKDMSALSGEHVAALQKLQEAYTNSLSKMGDLVTELESTKEALRGAEERRKHLEAEVERVTQQVKEEMEKVIEQKEEEIKSVTASLEELQSAKEENTGKLLKIQTRLEKRDEEMKAMETLHSTLISQLQEQLQLQTKEKEEVLRQIEEQRGQSIVLLQVEKEQSQKWLDEITQKKQEIMVQLLQEKEDKIQLQAALQEQRATLETEQKAHQQVRSEVVRLQTELESLGEHTKGLVSKARLAESRLDELEQEGVNFQAQLALTEEMMQKLQLELEQQQGDKRALQQQVDALTQEKVTLQWEMEEQRRELQEQITEAREKSSETDHWKIQYEQLFAKVQPFQEQLNSFAAERTLLLNENGANQEELNKLSDAYAHLLGHQNQKQKIKHVMKLKDENLNLKQEVLKLRSQLSWQKSEMEQLKLKVAGGPQRRFDPSKAFQHNKENRKSKSTAPLKDGNHKKV